MPRALPAKPASIQWQTNEDLFGPSVQLAGGAASHAGRPRRSLRLMLALTLLKNSFDLSDEALVARFAENVYWQHFAGYALPHADVRRDPDWPLSLGPGRSRLGGVAQGHGGDGGA